MHMKYTPAARDRMPVPALEEIIARHGARAVFAATLAALVRRRRRRPVPYDNQFSEHLRRDIGLSPLPPAPRDRHLRW